MIKKKVIIKKITNEEPKYRFRHLDYSERVERLPDIINSSLFSARIYLTSTDKETSIRFDESIIPAPSIWLLQYPHSIRRFFTIDRTYGLDKDYDLTIQMVVGTKVEIMETPVWILSKIMTFDAHIPVPRGTTVEIKFRHISRTGTFDVLFPAVTLL